MPAEYEKLKAEIMESGRKAHKDWGKWSERKKAGYIYGTLAKQGWVKGKGGHMVKKG